MAEPRTYEKRKADTIAQLEAAEADAWVATASTDGVAHMVPLSIGWTEGRIVLVTESRSITARNLGASHRARVAVGSTRDVVMIVAEMLAAYSIADAPPQLLRSFAVQSGWNPSTTSAADGYRLLELRPVQIQAWREGNEIAGRTLMTHGEWVGSQPQNS
ncbi:MAG: pyridoxamine 5'-phosphate oxidase family protein [Actinomycetota bacterium]|nr:pyridoxamine 5'-phosphate oxidase family protein [Actinomycetota bacterium]